MGRAAVTTVPDPRRSGTPGHWQDLSLAGTQVGAAHNATTSPFSVSSWALPPNI